MWQLLPLKLIVWPFLGPVTGSDPDVFTCERFDDALALMCIHLQSMGEYRKLLPWEKAHALAIDVDRVAKRIHGGANASLRNQMIRAAMSVPANILEGRAQSAGELDYHLVIVKDIGAISEMEYWRVEASVSEVRKMLRGLIKKLLPVTG